MPFRRLHSPVRLPYRPRPVDLVVVGMAALLLYGCSLIPVYDFDDSPALPLRFSASHYPYRFGEITFSHELHDGLFCDECHGDVEDRESILAGELPPMRKCFECHDGVHRSNDCETCHLINRRERKPRFHVASWVDHHGDMAYREGYKCNLCHRESECQGCHATHKPRSHTLRFNRRTHGILATHDRRSCATCHETDFCVNCHSQPPPDHTPAFMGPVGHRQIARLKLRTCLTCHPFQSDCAGSGCHAAE